MISIGKQSTWLLLFYVISSGNTNNSIRVISVIKFNHVGHLLFEIYGNGKLKYEVMGKDVRDKDKFLVSVVNFY